MTIKPLKKFSYVAYILIDALIIAAAFFATTVVFYFNLGEIDAIPYISGAFYLLAHVSIFLLGGQYVHLWKFAGLRDYAKTYMFSLLTGLLYVSVSYAISSTVPTLIMSLFIVLATTNILMLSRIVAKFIQREKISDGVPRVRLAIIGGGATCSALLSNMETAKLANYEPVCIFDDDETKRGKSINGIKVIGKISDAPEYCKEHKITDIIIAIPSASDEIRKNIINKLSDVSCKLSMIPSVEEMINMSGNNFWSTVREVNVEDLLGREVIEIHDPEVRSYVNNKCVLISGGGGSIGSELCRQIAAAEPSKLVILDIYENNAYDIQQELARKYGSKLNLVVEIASVRDEKKLEKIFMEHCPQIVYHAAAHKHVPLMETNPEEAIKNNVFGTYNMAMLADKHCTEKFVLISSDKAVNPTNVMGATKRFCEMIVQSMKSISKTQYVAVRFGNVLGSNGSVVPLFKKQIAAGGPVTVTHKDIIRYFMTIPEAVQLVLITASKASSGNVYVLDMGDPVRIDDFAKKMINLSGFRPNIDIMIEYTGLRPGEKLYEELLIDNNTSLKTEHNKIFIEQLPQIEKETVKKGIDFLKTAVEDNNCEKAVDALKRTVTTFNHNGIDNVYTLEKVNAQHEKSIAVKKKIYVSKTV